MTFRDTITSLAGQAEDRALDLYARWEAGELDDEQFEALLAALVARYNSRAATVADLALAAAVTVALRRAVAPLGIVTPPGDPQRLRTATRTLREALEDTPDPQARVARLARAEPLDTAARSYSEGIARSRHVEGWVRGLSANACELCTWWARGGRIWPKTHRMPTHKGCTCTPIPTVSEVPIKPDQTTRRKR
ncbi:hypothetical protein ACFP6A_11540 [Quadrisphaera sp. GCM10027208]|uniref:VG15 protein n=1 Tax=Quadrisphaera sp. GCM10027208 TaxID=3273423 RepID=UPI00360FCD16